MPYARENMPKLSVALADTIMRRYPDPRSLPFKPWCYVHGYVLAGFEKLHQATGDPRYFDYVRSYVDSHVTADGQVPAFTGESLDDVMAGTAVIALYQETGNERYRRAAERIRRCFDDYPRNSDGAFWHARNLPHQMWIDGVFMGQVFLTRYGAAIADRDGCLDEAVRQIGCFADRLEKGRSGMFLHGFDESRAASWADRETGLSPEVWSEGLGWYALALVETLSIMGDHPGRERVRSILHRLVDSLARLQDERTGLWYQVVDKGARADNWHDTSGSAMFVYAIRRAVELGVGDEARLRSVAEKGFQGVKSKTRLGAGGLVDIHDACDGLGVQDSYERYVHCPRVVNAREAVGSVLWAAAIMEGQARGRDGPTRT